MSRKTANISTLPSGNISKLEFLTGKDVLPKKDLLGKAAASQTRKKIKKAKPVNVEKVIVLQEKIEEIFNKLKQVL